MKPRVLFVGGYGRSGSTAIDMKLAQVAGVIPVGEFRHLFGRALGDNELCSCGEPFNECQFWRQVLSAAFPAGFDREEIQRSVEAVNRLATVPALRISRLRSRGMRAHLDRYAAAFHAAYRGVLDVSGGRVVVDSSKYPLHGMALEASQTADLRVMLLVRDPRAVARSWQRKRVRPEVHWEERYMPQHSLVRSALAWSVSNRLTRGIGGRGSNTRTQRYEDFVADPVSQLEEIAEFALDGLTPAAGTSIEAHTVAGNPMRLSGKALNIEPDTKWMGEMGSGAQLLVAALCLPGMIRYRYSLAPMRSAAAKMSE